jgi:hypothetical protein
MAEVTVKALKNQICERTVQIVLTVIGQQMKKKFSDLSKSRQDQLKTVVATQVLEWKRNGIPSNNFTDISKCDYIMKQFDFRPVPTLTQADDEALITSQRSAVAAGQVRVPINYILIIQKRYNYLQSVILFSQAAQLYSGNSGMSAQFSTAPAYNQVTCNVIVAIKYS